MKKHTRITAGAARPTWQRKLLAQAIAMAGAGLQASAALAACPGTTAGNLTATCNVGPGQSATISTGGSIIVPSGTAIQLTGVGDKSITNSGILTGTPAGIQDQVAPLSSGAVTITNNAGAAINGVTAGIWINSLSTLTLTNNGTILGSSSSTAAGVVVSGDLKGSITNGGTITGTVNASEGLSALAGGIEIAGNVNSGSTITNTGTINANATASSSSAVALGIYISGDLAGTVNNSGTINATAEGSSFAYAAGIQMSSSLASGGTLTNSGTINATATASSVSAHADGIAVSSSMNGTLTNSGTINATATASSAASALAHGIYLSSIGSNGTLTNSGHISASASASSSSAAAFGIKVGGSGTGIIFGSLTNSGTIDVTATSANRQTLAEGIGYDGGEGITNTSTGTITVTANGRGGADAYGIRVGGALDLGAPLDNRGTITATASGTGEGSAYAAGIAVGTIMSGSSVTNSGTITASADNASAFRADGIYVFGMSNGSTLTNSGTITRNGESGTSVGGGGIHVGFLDSAATLTNSGTITANTPNGVGLGWAMLVDSSGLAGFPVITNSGTLNGNVHLIGASLNNSGLLSIPVVGPGFAGASSLVGGNYTQLLGGVLQVGVYSTTEHGALEVTGTADFTNSGLLAVNVPTGNLIVVGETIDNVVHAGTLVSGGSANLSVTDNNPFLSFTAVDDGENGIDLVATGQANPVMTAQSAQVTNLNLDSLGGLVMGRMDTMRLITPKEGSHDQNLWFRPFGSVGSQDDNGTVPGYDIKSSGIVLGYDTYLDDTAWNAGAAFGYVQTDVRSKAALLPDKINTDAYSLSVYGYWSNADHLYLDLMAIGGAASNDSTRALGASGHANGNYDSWYGRASAEVGMGFALTSDVTFTPSVSTTYTYVSEDSYNEKGPTGLALKVDSSDADSLIVGLDAQLAWRVNPVALMTAHVGGGYDALADAVEVNSSLGGGATFTTKGKDPDEWIGRGGVGVEFEASDRVEMHLNYEYEYRSDFENNLIVATLRWQI